MSIALSSGQIEVAWAVFWFTMRKISISIILLLTVSACASSEDDLEAATKRCGSLRDHLVELRLSAANEHVNLESHRRALRQALGDDFVARCRERPVNEIKCALAAKEHEAVTACSHE